MYSLDTETGPYPQPAGSVGAWALEPYRKEFYMKMLGIAGPDNYGKAIHMDEELFINKTLSEIDLLEGEEVYCHNAIFDIAVLIRFTGDRETLRNIKWRDTGLLAKWINNSQKDEKFRYSLRNCVEKWLPHHPATEEFLTLKDNIEDDFNYWLKRVIEDCQLTRDLAIELESLLPKEQKRGYIIECGCLYPLARGWMYGININFDTVEEMRIIYQAKINKGLRELGLKETTISSPKQLGHLLFNEWCLEPHSYTTTGNPCTAAGDLKHIALKSKDERISKLLEIKKAITIRNKYINGYVKARNYLNEEVIHPSPKLFNSYTGRMTYISKLFKKYPVSIALHQLPRKDKMVKRAMVARKGYKFFYSDFSAQELRLMAQFSQDKKMLEAFNNGKDLHSIMTENIYGTSYDTIVAGNKDEVPEIVDQRNCGKLTNLSSMYRIGAPSLQKKFFEDYDKLITLRESTHYLNSYKKTFRGIPAYWDNAINSAKKLKYASSISGRRFGITKMDWKGESSSINMPIQGSGMDLAEIQIALVSREFPEAIFAIQVHDSLTWQIPEDMDPLIIKDFINNIDYSKYVGFKLSLEFPMDCSVGYNLADMEAL